MDSSIEEIKTETKNMQAECFATIESLINSGKINYQAAQATRMYTKLAQFEIRLRNLEKAVIN